MVPKISTLSGYIHEYQKSVANPTGFWDNVADSFYWHKRWDKILEWDFHEPKISWFVNGKLNITENIFERHLFLRQDQPALIWEPNNPDEAHRILSYGELFKKVKKFSNVLLSLGLRKGDRVTIYLPMIPELTIAMLACARIGVIHSVVFAGFSANALADRNNDAEARVLITSDGGFRGNKVLNLKKTADESLEKSPTIERMIVVKRTSTEISWNQDRDLWWHELMESASEEGKATVMDSEDPLFILYTSGSTGKPKGVVHTTGGYMVYSAYTFRNVFQYSSGEVYFCAADIGWITGHSYIVYGPLLEGATTVMFEGIPNFPTPSRYWDIIRKFEVNQFYTSPTAIRSLMADGQKWIEGIDMPSLRVLGTVGEPINEDAWHWYHDHVGGNHCPIVDTWWQTETGGIMISPMAGIIPTKPAFATMPLPGIQPVIVDAEGRYLCHKSVEGNLCIKFPWPGIARTLWGDHERYKTSYFSQYPGLYFTGDGVRRDEDGYYRIMGRVDDVINVSGHRLGTAEIENAINEHPLVSESAVVGIPHAIKGQGIYAFVVCPEFSSGGEEGVRNSILKAVSLFISPIARPDKIQFVHSLPKTRSGKIMRRILRKIAEGNTRDFGDISTMVDSDVIDQIIAGRLAE
ncbi:MAG: acetate--CoA ligase [Bacteroidetes bacterium HGW-Bacteroidetes-16]|jgi:acetyl-CoA synthetase|nr:MAG: acetate--CoA ligase [Bacteroidetes bacterium HGW-Bacteroidetes-16]